MKRRNKIHGPEDPMIPAKRSAFLFLRTGEAFSGKLTRADVRTHRMGAVYNLVTTKAASPRLVKRGAEIFGPLEPTVFLAARSCSSRTRATTLSW